MIYLIKNTGTQHVKIGFSKAPEDRLEELQVGSAHKLIILASLAGGREYEKQLHNRFSDYRLEGEWFKGDILPELKEICKRSIEDNFAAPPAIAVSIAMSPPPMVIPIVLGTIVLGRWKRGENYYIGKITDASGSNICVEYSDGDKEWTTTDMVKFDVLGVAVQSRWQGRETYYPGKITEISNDQLHISYDDGTNEWTALNCVRLAR